MTKTFDVVPGAAFAALVLSIAFLCVYAISV